MNDLRGIFFLMLFGLPVIASVNDECRTHFKCINATHFHICGDFGDGKLRTIKSVVFSCPPLLVCDEASINECHYPVITTTTQVTTSPVNDNIKTKDFSSVTTETSTQASVYVNNSVKEVVVEDNNSTTGHPKPTTDSNKFYDHVFNTTEVSTIKESLRTHDKIKDVSQTVSEVNSETVQLTPGYLISTTDLQNVTIKIATETTDLDYNLVKTTNAYSTEDNIHADNAPLSEATTQGITRRDYVSTTPWPELTAEESKLADNVNITLLPEVKAQGITRENYIGTTFLPDVSAKGRTRAANVSIIPLLEEMTEGSTRANNFSTTPLQEITTEGVTRADNVSTTPLSEVTTEGFRTNNVSTTPLPKVSTEGGTPANNVSTTYLPDVATKGSTRTDNGSIIPFPEVPTKGSTRADNFSTIPLQEITTEGGTRADNVSTIPLSEVTTEEGSRANNISTTPLLKVPTEGDTPANNVSTTYLPDMATKGSTLAGNGSIIPLPEVMTKGSSRADNFNTTPLQEITSEGGTRADNVSTTLLSEVTTEGVTSANNARTIYLPDVATKGSTRPGNGSIIPWSELTTKESTWADNFSTTPLLEVTTDESSRPDNVSTTPLPKVSTEGGTRAINVGTTYLPVVATKGSTQAGNVSIIRLPEVTIEKRAQADNISTTPLPEVTAGQKADNNSITYLTEGSKRADNISTTPLPNRGNKPVDFSTKVLNTERNTRVGNISTTTLPDVTTEGSTRADNVSKTPVTGVKSKGNTRFDNISLTHLAEVTSEETIRAGNASIMHLPDVITEGGTRANVSTTPLLDVMTEGGTQGGNVTITFLKEVTKEDSSRADNVTKMPMPESTRTNNVNTTSLPALMPEGPRAGNVTKTILLEVTTEGSTRADIVNTTPLPYVANNGSVSADKMTMTPLTNISDKEGKPADGTTTVLPAMTNEGRQSADNISITLLQLMMTEFSTTTSRTITTERSEPANSINIASLPNVTTEGSAYVDNINITFMTNSTTEGRTRADKTNTTPFPDLAIDRSTRADKISTTPLPKAMTKGTTEVNNVSLMALPVLTSTGRTRAETMPIKLMSEMTTAVTTRANNAAKTYLPEVTKEGSKRADNVSTSPLPNVTTKKSAKVGNITTTPLPNVLNGGTTSANINTIVLLDVTNEGRKREHNISLTFMPQVMTEGSTAASSDVATKGSTSADVILKALPEVMTERSAQVGIVTITPLPQMTTEGSTQADNISTTSLLNVAIKGNKRANTVSKTSLPDVFIKGNTRPDNVSLTPFSEFTTEGKGAHNVSSTSSPEITTEGRVRADSVRITPLQDTEGSTHAHNIIITVLPEVVIKGETRVDNISTTALPGITIEGRIQSNVYEENSATTLSTAATDSKKLNSLKIAAISQIEASIQKDNIITTVLPSVETVTIKFDSMKTAPISTTEENVRENLMSGKASSAVSTVSTNFVKTASTSSTDGSTRRDTISTLLPSKPTVSSKFNSVNMSSISTTEGNIQEKNNTLNTSESSMGVDNIGTKVVSKVTNDSTKYDSVNNSTSTDFLGVISVNSSDVSKVDENVPVDITRTKKLRILTTDAPTENISIKNLSELTSTYINNDSPNQTFNKIRVNAINVNNSVKFIVTKISAIKNNLTNNGLVPTESGIANVFNDSDSKVSRTKIVPTFSLLLDSDKPMTKNLPSQVETDLIGNETEVFKPFMTKTLNGSAYVTHENDTLLTNTSVEVNTTSDGKNKIGQISKVLNKMELHNNKVKTGPGMNSKSSRDLDSTTQVELDLVYNTSEIAKNSNTLNKISIATQLSKTENATMTNFRNGSLNRKSNIEETEKNINMTFSNVTTANSKNISSVFVSVNTAKPTNIITPNTSKIVHPVYITDIHFDDTANYTISSPIKSINKKTSLTDVRTTTIASNSEVETNKTMKTNKNYTVPIKVLNQNNLQIKNDGLTEIKPLLELHSLNNKTVLPTKHIPKNYLDKNATKDYKLVNGFLNVEYNTTTKIDSSKNNENNSISINTSEKLKGIVYNQVTVTPENNIAYFKKLRVNSKTKDDNNSTRMLIENSNNTEDVFNTGTAKILLLNMSSPSNTNYTQNISSEMSNNKINNNTNDTVPKYINLETNNTFILYPAHLTEIQPTTSISDIIETRTLKDILNITTAIKTVAIMNSTGMLPPHTLKPNNTHITNNSSLLLKQPESLINTATTPKFPVMSKMQGHKLEDEKIKSNSVNPKVNNAINNTKQDTNNLTNSKAIINFVNITETNKYTNVSSVQTTYTSSSHISSTTNLPAYTVKSAKFPSVTPKKQDRIQQENNETNTENFKINTAITEIKNTENSNSANMFIKQSTTKELMEFVCLTEGRFSDVYTDQYYYICVKNAENFMRFKLRCQNGYHVNKSTVKCESNDENTIYVVDSSYSVARVIPKLSTTKPSTEILINTQTSRLPYTATSEIVGMTQKPIITVKKVENFNLSVHEITTQQVLESDTESEELEANTKAPMMIEQNTEPLTVRPVLKEQETRNIEIFKPNLKEVKHDMPIIADIETIQSSTHSTTSRLFKVVGAVMSTKPVYIDTVTSGAKIYKETTTANPLSETTETNKPTKKATSVIETTTSKKEIETPFKCPNKKNGKYAERNDCRTFYICTGTDSPVIKICPVGTVFSNFTKQCTKNQSQCIRNNEFECSDEGRFRDVFTNTYYYICVKNGSHFIRFKMGCQIGYHVNESTLKCVRNQPNLEQSSVSQDITGSSEHSEVEEEKLETLTEKHRTKRRDAGFECVETGTFPDPDNCRKYYVCSKRKDRLRKKRRRCKRHGVFHKGKRRCVSAESYECES